MSRLPQLQRALVAAAERVEAAPARTTLRRRRVRTLAIALAVALGLAGVAYAATQLIETGEPVPPPPHSGSLLDRIVPGTTRVLPVRAADPDGGPPWGLRVFRAKSGAFCVQTGRVVTGSLHACLLTERVTPLLPISSPAKRARQSVQPSQPHSR